MSSCWIRVRENKHGRSWQVLYRRGGRAYKLETGGTYRTKREANIRRDLIAGWLAAGLNPAVELAKLDAPAPVRLTVGQWAARYEASRIDHAPKTVKNTRSIVRRLAAHPIAAMPADAVTVADVQALVTEWAEVLKASSVNRYVTAVRLIFDFAGTDPNPARSPLVRLPAQVREEPVPPTADQFLRLLDVVPRRYRLPLVVLEQTAMRVGELSSLAWGDVDEAGAQFRLRAGETKGKRSRWVQVPPWLMGLVAGTCAREDRTEQRRVFPGLTTDALANAMTRGCRTAGMAVFSPHDLRHRRLSLWGYQGIPLAEVAKRAGHSRNSITADTYSHVLIDAAEVSVEQFVEVFA